MSPLAGSIDGIDSEYKDLFRGLARPVEDQLLQF
jgi:hypothetical protein